MIKFHTFIVPTFEQALYSVVKIQLYPWIKRLLWTANYEIRLDFERFTKSSLLIIIEDL